MSAAQLRDPKLFPRWLHAIKRTDRNAGDDSGWSGRLAAIKDSVKAPRTAVEKDQFQTYAEQHVFPPGLAVGQLLQGALAVGGSRAGCW